MESSNRLLSLDALRGIAVLLVLGRHMPVTSESQDTLGTAFLSAWHRGGWIGVDLFFVLSGFLVSGLLFRDYRQTGQLSIGRFLIRRGFKIYPAFYVFLGCTVALILLARSGQIPWAAILCEACFVQNYGPALWAHTWSLAVEEHFYLLLPLVLVLLGSRREADADPFRPVLLIFAVVAAVTLWLRCDQAIRLPYSHKTHLFPTHLRLDALSFGVAIAYLHHFRQETLAGWIRGREHLLLLLAVLLMIPPFVLRLEDSYFLPTVGLSCLYLAGGLLICAGLRRPLPRNYVVRLIAWIGFYSYSIYLWHFFVLRVLAVKWPNSLSADNRLWGFCLVYLLSSVFTGVFMAKAVEYPFLSLRERLFPSKTRDTEQQRPESTGSVVTEARAS